MVRSCLSAIVKAIRIIFLVNSEEFKEGVKQLAEVLNVPRHPDHTVVLEACCKLIVQRLSDEALQKVQTQPNVKVKDLKRGKMLTGVLLSLESTLVILCFLQLTFRFESHNVQGEQMKLENFKLGFDTNDPVLNNVCRVMRLLHVHELRDLQVFFSLSLLCILLSLQNAINETIVAVQSVSADPKTALSQAKVGRS